MGWSTLIESKPDGGLGIRDLSLAKHSLMPKHIFKYLNYDDAIWVDILINKYGKINLCSDAIPAKCSWFFRDPCHSAAFIRSHCKINSVNPDSTSFLWDPWMFDIPVALKPTFLNLDLDLEQINLFDFITGNCWNPHNFTSVFGNLFDSYDDNLASIDLVKVNHWVWLPRSNCTNITSVIYHFLNQHKSYSESWTGWQLIWHIPVVPRLKYFIWLCLKGPLSTSAFLYSIHMGPDNPCIFCGLHSETTHHLFCNCIRVQSFWDIINCRENLTISFPEGFSSGS